MYKEGLGDLCKLPKGRLGNPGLASLLSHRGFLTPVLSLRVRVLPWVASRSTSCRHLRNVYQEPSLQAQAPAATAPFPPSGHSSETVFQW